MGRTKQGQAPFGYCWQGNVLETGLGGGSRESGVSREDAKARRACGEMGGRAEGVIGDWGPRGGGNGEVLGGGGACGWRGMWDGA